MFSSLLSLFWDKIFLKLRLAFIARSCLSLKVSPCLSFLFNVFQSARSVVVHPMHGGLLILSLYYKQTSHKFPIKHHFYCIPHFFALKCVFLGNELAVHVLIQCLSLSNPGILGEPLWPAECVATQLCCFCFSLFHSSIFWLFTC